MTKPLQVNDAYLIYIENPTPENYEQLGKALLQYISAIIASKYGKSYYFLDEAIGETMCKVLENLPNFHLNKEEGKGNLAKWVYVLTRNACVDVVRQRYRRNEWEFQPEFEGKTTGDTLDRIMLKSLVAKLPPEEQKLVNFKIEGYDNEDIAQEMDLAVQTVKNRWGSLLERLRTLGGGN